MAKATRVLLVDHSAALGGAQLSLLDIAISLKARAAVALFEDGPLAGRLVGNGVALIPLHAGRALRTIKKNSRIPSPAAVMAAVRTTLELAKAARPFALMLANSPKSFLVSAAAGILVNRPVIWHLRDILDPRHFSATNIAVMVRTANARAVRVVANSHATAAAFVAAGGNPSIVVVVHNGIDPAPFDAVTPEDREAIRTALGYAPDDFVVGSFSRLHPWKGPQILLDAMERLPDARGLLVGGALFSGEEEFERGLRIRTSRHPLLGRVRLLGARDDVPALMKACDVVVHTSVLPEPFGRVLVEALLAERPLIAADAGGVREIVSHGDTALLTPPGDATALADAITELRAHPERAAALARAGSAHVRRDFTREAMIGSISKVVDGVLDNR